MNQNGDKFKNKWGLKILSLTKILTFVDANADAEGSTVPLHERCSGELKRYSMHVLRSTTCHIVNLTIVYNFASLFYCIIVT